MRILVTGASGFVGKVLGAELTAHGHVVHATVRSLDSVAMTATEEIEFFAIGDIEKQTKWSGVLTEIDCVIHCAARAHVMHETAADALAAYRNVNVAGTRNLAEQAAAAGVMRFIYISSIKVNGESTDRYHLPAAINNRGSAPRNDRITAFTDADDPSPEDPYGISKWEAEQALHEVARNTGMEVVIIRPPLVYGPMVKGNFIAMLSWLQRGIPLPLGAIDNKRSLVGIDNLIDLIITCIDHPAAANQTFLVSDDHDLSTTELLHRMSLALGKPARLIPVPARLLHLGAKLLGKQNVAQRLLGNLQVDIAKTKAVLGWTPPYSVDEGLRKTAEWYLNQ